MTREEAIKVLKEYRTMVMNCLKAETPAFDLAIESLSAEPKWITDRKPTEEGTYMVTLDAFGQHRFIKLMYYGKPLLPNREVKGMCWYHSDSEWGDIVYDDEDILAWLPLPTPYGESEAEE